MTPCHPYLCRHQLEAIAKLCEAAFKAGVESEPDAKFEETPVAKETAKMYYKIIGDDPPKKKFKMSAEGA